ncbi:MAG: mevalonate kinase, partial [Anaerolineae bacterium]|nr:mevalonate kinase [Anaerolineae bacterium]
MPAITGSAPGKIILFGEHAVVYGRPALAVPVNQVQAKVSVFAAPGAEPGQVIIDAPGIGLKTGLERLPQDHPLVLAVLGVMNHLSLSRLPACTLRITSTIPIAAGLGSGAAVSVAIARALSSFLGKPLNDENVNEIAFAVDQAHHGTPSGVDNTVITYNQPVYFVRGQPFERLPVKYPFTLVIGNTGVHSATAAVVSEVRRRWQSDPNRYEALFDRIADLSRQARQVIEQGHPPDLGPLMNANHALLIETGVSSAELDRLVDAARAAGALGAKLCGAGWGGNMIALVEPGSADRIVDALKNAGAVNT